MADYDETIWSTGDVITAALLNHGETQYATAKAEVELGNWVIPASAIETGTFDVTLLPVTIKQLLLDAGSGTPRLSNGCASLVQRETATNKQNYASCDFDHVVNEYIQWRVLLPDSYNGNPFTARFVWSAGSGSGQVRWGIQMQCVADDGAIDAAWGTAVEINDTLGSVGDLMVSDVTGNITPSGTPAAGKYLFVQVYRDAADTGNDTLASDAYLMAVKLELSLGYSD